MHHEWEIQNEIRYSMSLISDDIRKKSKNGEEIISCKRKYYDIPIKDTILKDIMITLGYNISPGNKKLVYMMKDYYNSTYGWTIDVKESELLGKVRAK